MIVTCPKCGKNRNVSRTMVYFLITGKCKLCKSCANKGNKSHLGQKCSVETKLKMSLAAKGKKKSLQHRLNISKGRKGIRFSEEHLKNLSISHLTGDEPVKRQERNDSAYRIWVRKVKKRDKTICKINNEDCSGYCVVHHILPWSEYPELRYEINNGITLCQVHHPRVRTEEKRLIPFLQGLVSVSN